MADWQNIPQELIDRFVDECRWDVESLRNLSLVSRPWLSRTRYYLFRSITLAPRDIKEIYEYKSYLTRAKTSPSTRYYVPMSLEDRRLLDSSLDPTPQNVFLSSTPNILHYVRCLHLESSIRTGGSRKLTPIEYFQRYLGFGEDSLIVRDLTSDEGLFDLQQKRWASVDLPWGQFGLLELPFCKLQYVHIQWSVFSWMLDDSEVPSGQWLGFQFGALLKANEGTLDHVSIDEYPGFAWREEDSSELVLDGLLHLLAQNAPQIRTLCLQGPLLPRRRASRRHSAMHPTPNVWDRPLARYPSGEEVPPVFSNPDGDDAPSNGELSIKHLFLRGFTSDSMVLIEDAFLNSSVLSRLESLALSAMPDGFNYKVFLSTLRHSLTHLTLEFNESTTSLNLRISRFPRLECVQFIVYHSSTFRGCRVEGFLRGPESPAKLRRLHFSFDRDADSTISSDAFWSLMDFRLQKLITQYKNVELVTANLSERELGETFPYTFQTGCLRSQETDEWWCQP